MKFTNVALLSLAHIDAPHRMASAMLERRIEKTLRRLQLQPGLLDGLSGIRARRFWDEGVQPSDAAAWAAERALGQLGLERTSLGVLINSSVCRDYVEPSTAAIVHGKLGLGSTCVNFDVVNACLGFITAMDIIGGMIDRGQVAYGLVVDAESSRFVVDQTLARLARDETTIEDFQQHFATLTLGSGAAAMVLGRADEAPAAPRLVGSVSLAASEHRDLCRGQVDHMETDSRRLIVAGIDLARRTWDLARDRLDWSPERLDEVVLHQVSKVHCERVLAALKLSPGKALAIYPEYGNVGPAAVPIALSKAAEAGRLFRGARVALMSIGSGLNCTMTELAW